MKKTAMMPIGKLKPYKHNPRKISAEAVDAVAESIKQFGFRGYIQIEKDGTIINGHTRVLAAKKLHLTELPCEIVDDLEAEQIRKYRLIDNKSAEYSRWDADLLGEELLGLDFGNFEFDFDFTGDLKKQEKWKQAKKLCNLKDHVAVRKANDSYYHSLFKTGKDGRPLEELKTEVYVPMFAETAAEYIRCSIGWNLNECGWALLTTPRRRHAEGFHFSTAVCQELAETLQIPFYQDAIHCKSRHRIDPVFSLETEPEQKNLILYDDIITTGFTMSAARELLVNAGYAVTTLISIDNH